MNLFRLVAIVLTVVFVILLAALLSMIYAVTTGEPLTDSVRNAILLLALIVIVVLILIRFFLCLSKAKERLRQKRQSYRDAHSGSADAGHGHDGPKAPGKVRLPEKGLYGLCDALVRRKLPRHCIDVPIKVTRRPDPCIYSQFALLDYDPPLPVTWDNPDVKIERNGVEQYTYDLTADTAYDVTVFLKNASPLFDAIGTNVQVNMLTFGAGAPVPTPLTQFIRDIPAGTVNHSVSHTFQWTTPAQAGHYCLQVLIAHPDDINPRNNEGWNNTEVKSVSAGEEYALMVPMWNPWRLYGKEFGKRKLTRLREYSKISVRLDSYELSASDPLTADPNVLFTPRPALWNATVDPGTLELPVGSDESKTVTFRVTVPNTAVAGDRAAFNITGMAGTRPIGGVTVYLNVQ